MNFIGLLATLPAGVTFQTANLAHRWAAQLTARLTVKCLHGCWDLLKKKSTQNFNYLNILGLKRTRWAVLSNATLKLIDFTYCFNWKRKSAVQIRTQRKGNESKIIRNNAVFCELSKRTHKHNPTRNVSQITPFYYQQLPYNDNIIIFSHCCEQMMRDMQQASPSLSFSV